jgi:hypothetical protein
MLSGSLASAHWSVPPATGAPAAAAGPDEDAAPADPPLPEELQAAATVTSKTAEATVAAIRLADRSRAGALGMDFLTPG